MTGRSQVCGTITRARPLAAAGASTVCLPPFLAVAPAVSPVPAHGDYDGAAAAGAESPGVRVIGKCDARSPQLVDQACYIGGSGQLYGAVALRRAFAGEEDGHGGQVRQDPALPHIGVLRPGGSGRAALV